MNFWRASTDERRSDGHQRGADRPSSTGGSFRFRPQWGFRAKLNAGAQRRKDASGGEGCWESAQPLSPPQQWRGQSLKRSEVVTRDPSTLRRYSRVTRQPAAKRSLVRSKLIERDCFLKLAYAPPKFRNIDGACVAEDLQRISQDGCSPQIVQASELRVC